MHGIEKASPNPFHVSWRLYSMNGSYGADLEAIEGLVHLLQG